MTLRVGSLSVWGTPRDGEGGLGRGDSIGPPPLLKTLGLERRWSTWKSAS